MAKIGKKRSNPNSVEAYACSCICTCIVLCYCNPVCPPGDLGITSSELTNQVHANPANHYIQIESDSVTIGAVNGCL